MGIFDKAKEVLADHSDKVDGAIDKLADVAEQKTGGQHSDKIEQGSEAAKDKVGEFLADKPPAQ